MASSVSSLVNNLAAELQKAKCEKINLTFSILGQRHHKCLHGNKNYEKKFDENLTNFVSYCRKLLIHMSSWIASKSSMGHHFPQIK